ncbi:MAG TPA: DUF2231 domain-containing protein [Fimbriimonadales bacterium]|nr:DUF2231 domain-containing protein [Fimbriimonadales bacterium]
MRKPFIVCAMLFGSFFASDVKASSEFLDTFLKNYKLSESSKLAEHSCGICHVSDSDFTMNPYGKQLREKMAAAGADRVTEEILKEVENLDADGDGVSNLEAITSDKLPGGEGKVAAPTVKPPPKPLIPKNAFHPAVVHFPIALFLAALVLDLYGLIRKDKTFLFAGWYNLLFAAISAVVASLTGVAAGVMLRVPLRGLIAQHMAYALAAAFVMWMMVALRVHRHQKMNVPLRVLYFALAVVGLVTLVWAGHLGGVYVYGE